MSGDGFKVVTDRVKRVFDRLETPNAMPELCSVGVAVLLFGPGGGLLVGQRLGTYGGGEWSVPGGKLERGETPLACAERELYEETGIRAELQMLPFATWDGMHPEWPDYVTLWAIGSVGEGAEPKVMEPTKCARWIWCPKAEDLPEPVFRCLATAAQSGLLELVADVDDQRLLDFAAHALGMAR